VSEGSGADNVPIPDPGDAVPARSTPSVSVVIPARDDAEELRRCLELLAGQTRPADEVIVVDNASRDDTAEVARRGGARVVECARRGIPAASAAGLDAATGDLLLRLDADCRPDADWIDEVVRAFERHPSTAAFTGGARFVDGPRIARRALAGVYLGAYTAAGALALGHRPLFGSNLAIRAAHWCAVAAAVHRDDPEIHDDLDLSFHLGERGRIRRLPRSAMGMSMRPLFDTAALRRRFARGHRTVIRHWPHDFPPARWMRMLRHRLTASGQARNSQVDPSFAGPNGAPPSFSSVSPSSVATIEEES
jgi:glycosyltransferase involved in cell wall biosynthesis